MTVVVVVAVVIVVGDTRLPENDFVQSTDMEMESLLFSRDLCLIW